MVSFTYDSKYKVSFFNEVKRKSEAEIKKYISSKFKSYTSQDIEFILLPSNFFENGVTAITVPKKKIIKFDFDKFSDYLIHLKKRNGKLIMPDIRKKHNQIFNALHHEMQHIVNDIELKDAFSYINSLDSCGYIKVGISSLLDEYIASYSAQKQFFNESGAIEALTLLCEQKNLVISSDRETPKIDLYINIYRFLAYAIAEYKVVRETKGSCDDFLNILERKNLTEFSEIFNNIREILENYNPEHYKEYVQSCENEMIRLLTVLHADFDFLRAVDTMK